MTVERARVKSVRKPWGCSNLQPWSGISTKDGAIGELWFQRNSESASKPALLLKLLFTREPLSIQVHPTDSSAQSIGLTNGKSEAWYILAAKHDAKIALGLLKPLNNAEFRAAVHGGTIADHVAWRRVHQGDAILVPAGTIHAVGGGLVLAEIQQNSDTTFRIFDRDPSRELHRDEAIAVAHAGPAEIGAEAVFLGDGRTLLITDRHFVMERLDLVSDSNWTIRMDRESWLLTLKGHARIGLEKSKIGEAMFFDTDTTIKVGTEGLVALLAYVGPTPSSKLLEPFDLGISQAKAHLRHGSSAGGSSAAARLVPAMETYQ